jgi:glutathione synthase/RimK-type ligase-like ATP-grasp enzyme
MSALVCYDPWSLARNLAFARALSVGLRRHFGSARIAVVGPGDRVELDAATRVVVARTRDLALRRWLEQRVPTVLNSSLVALIGNDKLAASRWLNAHHLPAPRAIPASLELDDLLLRERVLKPRFGHGGVGVQRLPARSPTPLALDHWLVEPMYAGATRVLRAYVVGSRIAAWTERVATDGLAANVHRGATARLVEPEAGALALAERVRGLLGEGYYGIDIFAHEGAWLVNEVEDVVGARVLRANGMDVVGLVVEAVAHACGR